MYLYVGDNVDSAWYITELSRVDHSHASLTLSQEKDSLS